MALRTRHLATGEEIVVEVNRGSRRLVGPMIAIVAAAAVGIAATVLSTGHQIPPSSVLLDDRKTLDLVLRWIAIIAGLAGTLSILWAGARWLRWRRTTVAVTTDRVVSTSGVVRQRMDQVLLQRVVDAHVDVTVRDRIARRGTVVIELADGPPVAIDGLRSPESFQRVVLRQAGILDGGEPWDEAAESRSGWERPVIITELAPTPPFGTPAVTTTTAAEIMIRLDEIDRLETEGVLSPAEARRRRAEIDGRP
jgi:hypothetical protein